MNRIKSISDRGRLRKEIGRLHLQVLLKERGYKDEFTGEEGGEKDFARFHILTVAAHPRLEFVSENIIIYLRKNYWVWHEPYHHDRDSTLGRRIMDKIIELRGTSYYGDLLDIERYMSQHSKIYLLARRNELKEQLKELT